MLFYTYYTYTSFLLNISIPWTPLNTGLLSPIMDNNIVSIAERGLGGAAPITANIFYHDQIYKSKYGRSYKSEYVMISLRNS